MQISKEEKSRCKKKLDFSEKSLEPVKDADSEDDEEENEDVLFWAEFLELSPEIKKTRSGKDTTVHLYI